MIFNNETHSHSVGQCGNQIGGQFWNLALEEYGIQECRRLDTTSSRHSCKFARESARYAKLVQHESSNSFFWNLETTDSSKCEDLCSLKRRKIKAKAILVDMEDGVISQLKKSKIGDIFDDQLKITHYPGSGNNWAVGHTVHGKNFREALINVIRRAVEKCGCLQGFILLCSLGGGTGSGLGTYILKILEEDFHSVERFVGCVYPDENDDVITSPYNVLMSSKVLTEHATCIFPFDNKALISICDKISTCSGKNPHALRNIIPTGLVTRNKPFQDMNSLIVKMLLDLTSSSRYSGSLNLDINEIYSNMVPFPKMQYISSGLSPLYSLNYKSSSSCRQDELFTSCWSLDNQLCRYVNPLHSTLLAVSLIGRGPIVLADMRKQVERLQAKAKFAPWALESVKAGLCSVPPLGSAPASLLGLFNSTGIVHLLGDVLVKFSKLYTRKAHLHHYLAEGVEVSDIEDCVLTMQDVIHHYKGVNTMIPEKAMPQLSVH